MTDISGKLVIVTGAASGIGRATAQTAAERGARVVLTDISPLDETIATIQAAGGEVAHAKSLDITDVDAVMTFAQEVHDSHGSVDVVMNVAGISAWGTVSALEHRHWRSMVEVNLMGPIHIIEAFVPAMVALLIFAKLFLFSEQYLLPENEEKLLKKMFDASESTLRASLALEFHSFRALPFSSTFFAVATIARFTGRSSYSINKIPSM